MATFEDEETLTDMFEERSEPRAPVRAGKLTPYESAARLAARDPAALRKDPRTRAALHVALHAGALAPADVIAVLPAILDGPGALRETSSVLTRARILDSCHAYAIAASTVDADALEVELHDRVVHVLAVLSRDRHAAVATPAAAALGALSLRGASGGSLEQRLEAVGSPSQRGSGPQGGEGVARRRLAVAKAIAWLLGDGADQPLRARLGSLDTYATAEVIRALGRWRAAAPATADRAAAELGEGVDPTVLHASGEYALYEPSAPDRAARIRDLSDRVADLDMDDPVLELWRGRHAEPARDVVLAFAELRACAARDLESAGPIAVDLLGRVGVAIERTAELVRGPAVDAYEAALDIALLGSPLLHDALIATSSGSAEAKSRRKQWEECILELRRGRFERLRKNVRGKYERREAVRKLVHVVDATPVSAEPPPQDPVSAKSVFAKVRSLMADNDEQMLDRPLARAFAVAIERAAPDAASIETLGLVLGFRADPFKKYAEEFASGKLVLAARALINLRAVVDETLKALSGQTPGPRGKRKLARELLPALREVSSKMGLLGDHAIVRGLDDLVGVAVHLVHQRRPSAAMSGVVADAIETLCNGTREAALSLGVEAPAPPRNQVIQRRVEDMVAKPTGKAGQEAKRELDRMLPPILVGLLDSVLALQGALDKEPQAPPAIIGDYQVVRALGAGGMGACLLVRSRSKEDERHYVLKLPQRTSAHYRSWFRREALALLSLAEQPHRGIVRFVSFHDGIGGKPHLVMEWVDGPSLEGRIEKTPLPLGQALSIAADLASAVAHAHAQGIGHYDIKPANVVLHLDSQPVLVDWGISGATCKSRVGTPFYMAPERLASEEIAKPLASDVFSLGCVLPELLSGKRLFSPSWENEDEAVDPGFAARLQSIERPGGNEQAILARLHGDPKVLAARVERLLGPAPRGIHTLVMQMLHPDAAKRPTAADVERGLRAWI